jgi:hypothetical protein
MEWYNYVEMQFERFREWLAFKIFPEVTMYMKINRVVGGIEENDRVVELIEQSKFKNKREVIKLVKTTYHSLNDVEGWLDDQESV